MKHLFIYLTLLLTLSFPVFSLDISILKGDKLFNKNTPIIINLDSPNTADKKSNVDLICVIDISGSMRGDKINQVKDSLNTLVKLMDSNDRLGLVVFNTHSSILSELTSMTPSNKITLTDKINSIHAGGGTSILSGLENAVNMLEQSTTLTVTSSVILLSDGMDSNLSEIELTKGLKDLTKGKNLSFTLHTFGYGLNHDPLTMTNLANIRDGSFYFVEDIPKVKAYFVNVLGGCMSVIGNNLKIKMRTTFNIDKVFGLEDLFAYTLEEKYFETEILQLISGKEYTYVVELNIPNETSYGIELLNIEVKYVDLKGKEHSETAKFMYAENKQSESGKDVVSQANEEYIRSKTYESIHVAMESREKGDKEKALNELKEIKEWLSEHYKGEGNYLEDVKKSESLVEKDNEYETGGRAYMTAVAYEARTKRGGRDMMYSNQMQKALLAMI